MLRKLFFTLGLLLTTSLMLYSQGTLTGTITDQKTGEALPFVNVIVVQDGQQKGGSTTDMNGNYQIKPLAAGTYDVVASSVGYKKAMKTGVRVAASGFSTGGSLALEPTAVAIDEVVITEYAVPLLESGTAETGKRITSDDIEKMAANSVDAIIATVGGVTDNDGSAGSARGESGMVTYVNGVKRSGSNIPKQAIAEVQVILGGTPARYGESVGGTTNITLRPPANKFLGMVNYETSEPFDTRGYHRLNYFFSGPLYKKKYSDGVEKSIIGYRLSGFANYSSDRYNRPKGKYYYMVKEDVLQNLNQSPLRLDPVTGVAVYNNASYLTMKDFEQVGRKPNLWTTGLVLEGGLDFRFSDNSSLQINAEYNNSYGKGGSSSGMLLNNANNSISSGNSFVVSGDFTQRFSNASETSTVKNIIFNLSASYSRSYSEIFDPNHGDNLFRYGHVGTFKTYKRPTYELTRKEIDGVYVDVMNQNGWLDYQVDFTPSEYNPGLARYTWQLYNDPSFESIRGNLINYENIRAYKGLVNGDRPDAIYESFTNVGVNTSSFSKNENQNIFVNAKISADIGSHALELGFQYDQGVYRGYNLNASGLWTIMKQNVNQHILYLDTMPIIDNSGSMPYISYNRKVAEGSQTYFDRAVRQKIYGNTIGTEFIDIDSYNPEFFSLDMLSADEMLNSGNSIVSYYGYDHRGNKISGKPSLQDFFTNKDSRLLGAWQPIYMAGYIQDQFYFKDLIFNIGVRVDRFDGNQMALKDPYLLYNAYTAGDLGLANSRIGSDYTVYVNRLDDQLRPEDLGSPDKNFNVLGYRKGNVWYNANGEIVSNPLDISGTTGQPLPYRSGTLTATGVPSDVSVDAFENYKPQVVAMPRIAFSFPVSDKSEFKASYDMIARRPSGGWQANYVDYLFMAKNSGATLSNPALKPEKITNYELGFQQVLSKSSMIGISAYYKETRDLISVVQYVGADPASTYYSYGNQDFKTTKGATITYDLRRSKNIRINASYTLQYAEGTTSIPGSTLQSLIRAGYPNIKMLNPIGEDRRHEFKVLLDFRYLGGDQYNGPVSSRKVKDKDGNDRVQNIKWLQNFGVNIVGFVGSGMPYTRRFSNTQNTIVGSINGARLPWSFRLDLNIDKSYNIKVGKKMTTLNLYARISNLLNTRNVSGVFAVTGDPEDNGYLTDPETQTIIASQLSEQSFRDYYMMNLNNNSYNYSRPRMIQLGIMYTF